MYDALLKFYYISMKLSLIDKIFYLRKTRELLRPLVKSIYSSGLTNRELVLVNAKQPVCCEISNSCWRTLDISRNYLWTRSQTI